MQEKAPALAAKIRRYTKMYGRLPVKKTEKDAEKAEA